MPTSRSKRPAGILPGDQQEEAGDDDEQVEDGEAADRLEAGGPVVAGPRVRQQVGDDQADDEQVRNGQQPLDQDQAAGEVFGVRDVEFGRIVGPGQGERRVAVGAQGGVDVEPDPPVPAQHADVEVEQRPRIAAGEQDGEAGDHGGDQRTRPTGTPARRSAGWRGTSSPATASGRGSGRVPRSDGPDGRLARSSMSCRCPGQCEVGRMVGSAGRTGRARPCASMSDGGVLVGGPDRRDHSRGDRARA